MSMLDWLKRTIIERWTLRRWRKTLDDVLETTETNPARSRTLLATTVRAEYEKYVGGSGSLLADFNTLAQAEPAKTVCDVPLETLKAFDAKIESLAREAHASRRPLDAIAAEVDALIADVWPNAIAGTMLWPRERTERLCRLAEFVSDLKERIEPVLGQLEIDPNAPAPALQWLVDALRSAVGANHARAWQAYGRAAAIRKNVQPFLKKFNWGTYLEQQWKTVLAWGAAFVFLAACVYRWTTLAAIGTSVREFWAVTSLFGLPDQKDSIVTALYGVLIFGASAFGAFRRIWKHEFQNALLRPERFNGSTLPVPDDAPPLGLQLYVFVAGLGVVALVAFMHAGFIWSAVAQEEVAFHFGGSDASASGRCVAGVPIGDQGNGKIYLTKDEAGVRLVVVKDATLAELATHDDCTTKNIDQVARFDVDTKLPPPGHQRVLLAPISLRNVAFADGNGSGFEWIRQKLERLSNDLSFVIGQNLDANLQLAQQLRQLSGSGLRAKETSVQLRAYEELQQCLLREQKNYSWMQRTGISKASPQCDEEMQKLTEALSPPTKGALANASP